MDRYAKFLVPLCILVIFLGVGFLWFGLQITSEPSSAPQPIATASAQPEVVGVEGEKVLVTRVIDGDTIEIEGKIRVRYLGVDTPETVDPRKSVECFGKQAKAENKKLVEGKFIVLEKDITDKDKYRRLLRYVFIDTADGELLFVNDYLIRSGFAKLLTIPPDVKYANQLLEAQKQARLEKRGLWKTC